MVSLALGIAGNAVVFSLIDAVLLDPFPYRDADRLAFIWGSKSETQTTGLSGADVADWRSQNRSFTDIDAFLGGNMAFSLGAGESDRVRGACIGHRVLPMLGVYPALGRNFSEDDTRGVGAPVTLISDNLWRSRYAANPDIVGSRIRLDGQFYEVVGVTPPGFFFPDTDARLWVAAPCGFADFHRRGAMSLHAIGRLKPGVSVREAQADIDQINRALARAYPATNQNRTAGIFSLRTILIGKYERALWTLAWAMAAVLLIACANVVHLQLVRGVDREIELAVRAAAGASRRRLMRQLLSETALLVAVSTTLGVALAWSGVRTIHAFSLTEIPRMEAARLDLRVLGFTLAVSFATAIASGLWPAWKASRVDVADSLKVGAGTTTNGAGRQARDLLAIAGIATAVVLLVASGLLVRSFVGLSRAHWGFNPDNLLLIDVTMPKGVAAERTSRDDLTEDIRRRLASLPGVERVTASGVAPIRWRSWAPRPLEVDGRIPGDLTAAVWTVGRDYFSTAGIRLIEGREFDHRDGAAAPRRTVVSRTLAAKLWPHQSALGKSLKILQFKTRDAKSIDPAIAERLRRLSAGRSGRGWPEDRSMFDVLDGATWEVIGVADDVRMFGLSIAGNPALYLDARQRPAEWVGGRQLKVMLRADAGVLGAAKDQILAANKDVAFNEIVRLDELVAQSIGGRGSSKLLVLVASIFGALALTFATIGIYGVVAHNVRERLREIGIRIALGAGRGDVGRMVAGYAFRLLASGLGLGLTAAWAATRSMRALLFGVTPTDVVTYLIVVAVLAVASLAACAGPFRRAIRFDPVVIFNA